MRAALYRRKGSARDVLEIADIDIPDPSDDEVRVRLHTSGINPSDVKIRSGTSIGGMEMPFPEVVPHSDGAGTIEAAGKGATGLKEGDRVWVYNGAFGRAFGTAADAITLPVRQVRPLPENTSFAHGACLGIPAQTAVHAVTRGGDIKDKSVYISGGGGVVGRYCIQVAKALGAGKVVATASNPLSKETAEVAGADTVLDYRSENLASEIMDASGGIDHAVEAEFGINTATLASVVKPCGSIAAYGSALDKTPTLPFYDFMFKNIQLTMLIVYLLDDKDRENTVRILTGLLEDGALTENIAATLPLEECAAAHEMVEKSGKSGSVILDCSGS